MSVQDGVSGASSIEIAERPSAPLSSNVHHPPDGSHSLGGATEHNPTSTSKSQPNPTRPSSLVSTISQIPKLSAATTELLARVNGNKAGDIKDGTGPLASITSLNAPPPAKPSFDNPDLVTQGPAKMKASSAIIELPTPPFASSSAPTAPPSVPQKTSALPSAKTGLVPIAPKPVETTATPLQPLAPAPPVLSQPTATSADKGPKPAPASRQRRSGANAKRSRKRRRDNDSDDDEIKAGDTSSDESSDFTPIATHTKSGRQIHRPSLFVPDATPAVTTKPKANSPDRPDGTATGTTSARKRRRVYRKGKEMNVNCIHCQRGHSPSSNAIVFCDECNRAWHQFCHDPPIEKEVIAVKEMEWFCGECRQVAHTTEEVPSETQARFFVEPIQAPTVLPEAEVGGEKFTADEKRAYLSGLSHATLVNLLVSISDRNPTVPMFPSNLRDLPVSKFFSNAPISSHDGSSTAAARPGTLPPSSDPPNMTTNITSTADTSKAANLSSSDSSSAHPTRRKDEDSDDESEYEEVEEHRLYPRAGNGFRLPPDTEDLDMLLEDPACTTFSYALHGPAKARVESSGLISIGGTA